MRSQKSVLTLLGCALALAGASSALAGAPRAHTVKISGVVVAISARHHTLSLRSPRGIRARGLGRAARAGGSLITIVLGRAHVQGPSGSVVVGDQVTVNASVAGGAAPVAASITVVGVSNGGDAGKGAAIGATVAAVDAAGGLLTITVSSTDGGRTQPGSALVSVTAATILALSDTNGDGKVTSADVAVGDHVLVFTADATVDPIVALGILDTSHTGADHAAGGSSPSGPLVGFDGSVTGVDVAEGILTVTVSSGALSGRSVQVKVDSSTHYKGPEDGAPAYGLADLSVGDQVHVYTPTLDGRPILAVYLGDSGPASAPSSPGSGAPDTTGTRFAGTVTNVRGDGLTVKVSNGPLSGQTVVVSVQASIPVEILDVAGTLSQVVVGDTVEVYTGSVSGAPIRATKVIDYGVGGSQ